MIKLSVENFENIIVDNKIVLVDVKADWCGPCKSLIPILYEVSSELGDKVLIGSLDADENMELAKELNVRSLPTILIYKDGEIVDRSTGLITKQAIIGMVSKHMDESIEF